jgi:TRAP-type uncharacterized transport system fused permease subunit
MFIIYLGMMSFVTPPVAIAAFFAANLAKADPFKTGWAAMRFSWTAYIVPFLFVFSPSLLLQSSSWTETALSISTAVLGVWFVSAGMIGHALARLSTPLRIAFVVGGGLLMIPIEMLSLAAYLNVAGLAICLAALAASHFRHRAAAAHREVAAE